MSGREMREDGKTDSEINGHSAIMVKSQEDKAVLIWE